VSGGRTDLVHAEREIAAFVRHKAESLVERHDVARRARSARRYGAVQKPGPTCDATVMPAADSHTAPRHRAQSPRPEPADRRRCRIVGIERPAPADAGGEEGSARVAPVSSWGGGDLRHGRSSPLQAARYRETASGKATKWSAHAVSFCRRIGSVPSERHSSAENIPDPARPGLARARPSGLDPLTLAFRCSRVLPLAASSRPPALLTMQGYLGGCTGCLQRRVRCIGPA